MPNKHQVIKKNKSDEFNNESCNESKNTECINDLIRRINEKIVNMTFDTFNPDKEYVNKFRFVTKHSSDIKYNLLSEAVKIIDRKNARIQLNKYVNMECISDRIEKGLFEFALIHVTINKQNQFQIVKSVYEDKLYDLCSNLDVNDKRINNTTLLPSIISGKMKPYFIAFLAPEQLHPKAWSDLLIKRKNQEDAKSNVRTTDLYKCYKCGERKFVITTMQLRSADEPENKFLTCLVCYNTFIQ